MFICGQKERDVEGSFKSDKHCKFELWVLFMHTAVLINLSFALMLVDKKMWLVCCTVHIHMYSQ